MLKKTIELGRRKKIIPDAELTRIVADTTVQEKAITYPTDANFTTKQGKSSSLNAEKSA